MSGAITVLIDDPGWRKPRGLSARLRRAAEAALPVCGFKGKSGLTVLLLLAAFVTCETARWHPSLWRDALTGWAYVWILAALWLSVQPWRLRDWLEWFTASDKIVRVTCALRLVFDLFLITLGLTVFRGM